MITNQDFHRDSTPLNKHIVKELGLVRGAVACKVIYASHLKDGVCRLGLTRIAKELGVDKSTVSRALERLLDEEYIDQSQDATFTTPGHYMPTEKLFDLIPPVAERNTTVAECNGGVAECNQDKKEIRTNKNSLYSKPPQKTKELPLDEAGPLNKAVLKVCCLNQSMIINGLKLDYMATIKALVAEEATAPTIERFAQWWGGGDPPTLKQLAENWEMFKLNKPRRFTTKAKNGHQKSKKQSEQPDWAEKYIDALE